MKKQKQNKTSILSLSYTKQENLPPFHHQAIEILKGRPSGLLLQRSLTKKEENKSYITPYNNCVGLLKILIV